MTSPIPSTTATSSAAEQEWILLESLDALLADAVQALGSGEAQSVEQLGQQIQLTAQDLAALSLQIARAPQNGEAQLKRRQLLLNVRRQNDFCRAILRRWRRSLMLRQQLLEMAAPPAYYAEPFSSAQELL